MIKKIKSLIKSAVKAITSDKKKKVECSIDDQVVDCQSDEFSNSHYIGVPAPAYLPNDPWFSVPILSEKQITLKESYEQAIADQQILDESEKKESKEIHQKLYEMATANRIGSWQENLPGGSENFQSGPGGWMSGTGMN